MGLYLLHLFDIQTINASPSLLIIDMIADKLIEGLEVWTHCRYLLKADDGDAQISEINRQDNSVLTI